MKNFLNVIALVISASLLTMSCSKVETKSVNQKTTTPTTQNSSTVSKSNHQKCASSWGLNWVWDDETLQCVLAPLDCYDVIVVKPSKLQILTIFENAVNGNANDIKIFFTTQDWASLFPDLAGTDNLAKLQSGNYDMIMRSDASNIISYYAAGSKLPLTFENEEFVFQIDKSQL